MIYKNNKTGLSWDIVDKDTLKMVEKDSDFERVFSDDENSDGNNSGENDSSDERTVKPTKGTKKESGKDVVTDGSTVTPENQA